MYLFPGYSLNHVSLSIKMLDFQLGGGGGGGSGLFGFGFVFGMGVKLSF